MIRTKFSKFSETRPLWTRIKIGKKYYEVKKGDYIMDNGACLQFFAGDNRQMIYNKQTLSYVSNIKINEANDIPPLHKMKKVVKKLSIIVDFYFF